MQNKLTTYLVGGAVRDMLMGITAKDRDWVVVGSTPQEMLDLGFSQVGKDFPVFLHPETKEEYALARTERKVSLGHTGFECEFNPTVTLEDESYICLDKHLLDKFMKLGFNVHDDYTVEELIKALQHKGQ